MIGVPRDVLKALNSRVLCDCGHQQVHHVAGRLRCPVVVFTDDDQQFCPCEEFSKAPQFAPLDEAMRIADEQIVKWKSTLDWLAER